MSHLSWPADGPDLADILSWIRHAFAGRTVDGPTRVLRVKSWGVTAEFVVDGRPIVVKHSQPVLYPQTRSIHTALEAVCPDAIPPLLAFAEEHGWQRTAFAVVAGKTVQDAGGSALVDIASALGRVQVEFARSGDGGGLPTYDLLSVADTLADDVGRTGDVDPRLVTALVEALPTLRRRAEELVQAPVSIDHPDVQDTNALVRDDDASIVLLDWEEAMVGCPFFSLHRLLRDAELVHLTGPVRRAYVDSLQAWGDERTLDRWIELALALAPLKLAGEARSFARALGLQQPHSKYTTRLITDCLQKLTTSSNA